MKTQNILLLLIVLSLFSCKTTYNRSADIPEVKARPELSVEKARLSPVDEMESEVFKQQERLLIYDANLTIEVSEKEGVGEEIAILAKSYNGYLLRGNDNKTVIRVPSDSLKTALTKIATLGNVKNQTVTANDITANYTDLSIRLENAEKARVRYLELLDQAKTVPEILIVEKELERLNEKIDRLKGNINLYDELLTFSTISVYIEKRVRPGIIGYVFVGLWKGVKYLFIRD